MKFVDTHTHLYSEEFDDDQKEVIERAVQSGVEKFYLPAIDSSYTEAMIRTRDIFPDRIFLMAGLHPCSVRENYKDELSRVEEFMSAHNFYGIGETGLDYYWDKTFVREQKDSLHQHCRWSTETRKPLILHTRDSIDDTISIIKQYTDDGLKGIFHCFTGTSRQAAEIIGMGFFLGIGGVLTFKNSGLDQVIKDIDLKHMVLETDSPYLSPSPFRGKRNESARLTLVAGKLAQIKGLPVEDIAEITSRNAENIFSEKDKVHHKD